MIIVLMQGKSKIYQPQNYNIILRCPKCKNKMKYQSKSKILAGKRKNCVYCGKSFKVSENIIKQNS